jgi:hypothetical protein
MNQTLRKKRHQSREGEIKGGLLYTACKLSPLVRRGGMPVTIHEPRAAKNLPMNDAFARTSVVCLNGALTTK